MARRRSAPLRHGARPYGFDARLYVPGRERATPRRSRKLGYRTQADAERVLYALLRRGGLPVGTFAVVRRLDHTATTDEAGVTHYVLHRRVRLLELRLGGTARRPVIERQRLDDGPDAPPEPPDSSPYAPDPDELADRS